MTDWRKSGYVPDSDEDEEEFAFSASSSNPKAETKIAANSCANDILSNRTKSKQLLGSQNDVLQSVAEQLDRTISEGLQTIRDVLADTIVSEVNQFEADDSPLSSLPSSLGNSPRHEKTSLHGDHEPSGHPVELNPIIEQDIGMSELRHRRNLRIRNPIQLHPYVLEDAKYRTLMQARGLKPLHLPRPNEVSVQLSEQVDSQATDQFISSSTRDWQSFEIPSSPLSNLEEKEEEEEEEEDDDNDDESQSPFQGTRRFVVQPIGDIEDDLPDISQVLRQRKTVLRRPYAPTGLEMTEPLAEPVRGRGQKQSGDSLFGSNIDHDQLIDSQNDVFRIPPSLPGSSSPIDFIASKNVRLKKGTIYSKTPPGLPTPAISSDIVVSKRSRSVSASSANSTSTESDLDEASTELVQKPNQKLQHMTRRIRGVLPASWLRLDIKQQTNPVYNRRLNVSPSKSAFDKGVAKRTNSSAIRRTAGSKLHLPIFDFATDSESNEDGETTINWQDAPDKDVAETVDRQKPVFNLASGNEILSQRVEAEEDNEIDQMLPGPTQEWTAARKVSKKKKQQRQQQQLYEIWNNQLENSQAQSHLHPWPITVKNGRTKITKKYKKISKSPAMNVFEAPAFHLQGNQEQPRFLKLAARQARRRTQTNALPATGKFFQLATREDTEEVSEVIRMWSSSRKHQYGNHTTAATRSTKSSTSTNIQNEVVPPLQNRPSQTTQGQTFADLRDLKQSTNALLHKIRNKTLPASQGQINASTSNIITQHSVRTEDFKHGATLKYLFPHRNRSGHGQLLSRFHGQRQAQFESVPDVDVRYSVPVSRRIPKKVVAVRGLSISKPIIQQRLQSDNVTNLLKPTQPRGVRRRSRKGIPKASEVTITQSGETTNIPAETTFNGRNNYSRTEAPIVIPQFVDANVASNMHDKLLIDIARNHMTHIFQFASNTSFCNNIIADGLLNKTVTRSETSHTCTSQNGDAVAQVRILSTSGREETLGLYNLGAQTILSECHRSILDALTLWDCVSSEPILAVNDIVNYTEQALCFSDELTYHQSPGSMNSPNVSTRVADNRFSRMSNQAPFSEYVTSNYRSQFIGKSLAFVKESVKLLEPTPSRATIKNHLRLVNLLMIHVLQLSALAVEMPALLQQIKDTHEEIMHTALSPVLEWNYLNSHLLLEMERHYDSSSRMAAIVFGEKSAEAVTVLVAWYSTRQIFGNGASECFYQILTKSIYGDTQSNPVSHLSMVVTILSYIIPFTTLDSNGKPISQLDQMQPGFAGWSCLLPLISKFTLHVRNMDQWEASPLFRLFTKDLMTFIFQLVDQFRWGVTPALVKTLLEVYSSNDLVPFQFNGDAAAIFYDHTVIDHVPEIQQNDYDKFLGLIHKAIESLQFQSHDEVMDTTTTMAKDIRGLVYSLIPNNAQLYDAREELQAEQFLALKNHFALFVTLYRSSPEGCGPRVQQLEQQVDLEYSHLMVCKLAMAVWKIIAYHEMRRQVIDYNCLQEIGGWLRTIFVQLERRDHTGQADTKVLYEELFEVLVHVLDVCLTEHAAIQLMLPSIDNLRDLIPPTKSFGPRVTKAALGALSSCIKPAQDVQGNDSLTAAAKPVIKDAFQAIVQDKHSRIDLVQKASSTWFAWALSAVRSHRKTWYDFLEPRSSLSIDQIVNGESDYLREVAKQFFFGEIIETEKDSIFLEYRPMIFNCWVVALISTVNENKATKFLTTQIFKYGGNSLQISSLANNLRCGMKNTEDLRLIILQHIIRNVYGQQGDPESEWLAGGLDEGDMLELLRGMTITMKKVWIELQQDPSAQNNYARLMQVLVNELEIYPCKGFKLDPWFTDGKEFPRHSQTFDNMFKCRHGHEGGEIAKSSIVTFRMKCIEALRFDKQEALTEELNRVFCCTDPLHVSFTNEDASADSSSNKMVPEFSIDIVKQTQVIKVILPIYIQRAAMGGRDALAVVPVLNSLEYITRNIVYRIDNLDLEKMSAFILASFQCITATKNALDRAGANITPASSALLRYAHAAVQVIWSLFETLDLPMDEGVYENFVCEALQIATQAGSLLRSSLRSESTTWWHVGEEAIGFHDQDEEHIAEIEELAFNFSSVCRIVDGQSDRETTTQLTPKESELRNFALRDLQEGLASMNTIKETVTGETKVEKSARDYIKLIRSFRLFPEDEDFLD